MLKFKDSVKQVVAKPDQHKEMPFSKTSILDEYSEKILGYELIGENTNTKTKVYKIMLKNHDPLVLKIEKFDVCNTAKLNNAFREYYIGKTFGQICENCVKTLGMRQISIKVSYKMRVEILSEYGGASLREMHDRIKKGDAVRMMHQLIKVLCMMENKGIAHLDIKPRNLVWDEKKGLLKVIDFGTSLSFYRTRT